MNILKTFIWPACIALFILLACAREDTQKSTPSVQQPPADKPLEIAIEICDM